MTSIEIANNAAQEAAPTSHFRSCRMQSPFTLPAILPFPYPFIVVFWRAVLPLLRLVGFATRPGSNFVRLNYFILFHVAVAAAAATRCRLPG